MTGIWIVDAFTDRPFRGNPAAICLLDSFPEDAVLQRVAMEMNLSETAFVVPHSPLRYKLRWFTPAVEVNLCGHATLATAHVLRQTGGLREGQTVVFDSLSGELRAHAGAQVIELDFPSLPGAACKPHAALKSLGVPFKICEKNRDNYLVEVADYETLTNCTPDFRKLAKMDMQGVIVTTATGVPQGFDFASRYFGPPCGIDEDPVTGSAHCFLAPYWSKKLGQTAFRALQASRRRGELDIRLKDERVMIAGTAVTTLKGDLLVSLSHRKGAAA